MATHVICIGGSGLRVLRSMVMLLSSGYDIKSDIKAYIIDPHLSSTEYQFTTGLIQKYQAIRGQGGNTGFFQVQLDVDSKQPNGMTTIIGNQTFGDFIQYNQMDSASKQIVDILYNGGNITNSMSVGFKGHPNVGSVVLQDLVNDNWFASNFSNLPQGDRIVIVGSLFGGTGASGIQTIAQALRTKNPQLEIAAVIFAPYYTLQNPPTNVPKDVDSDLWDIKSWAALKYYQSADFGINSFYVVGDGTTDAIPYDEVNQGNKAHFVEIVAVSAINHFVQTPTNVLQRWNMFSTQWNQNFRGNLDYNMWGVELREEIACLARFYAFGKFFNMMREDKFYPVNRLFYQKINGDASNNARLKDLESLIFSNDNANDSFMKWIVELRENKRSFTPINTSDVEYKNNAFLFTPSTPNAVYNGTDVLKDVNMSDCFTAVNTAYRKSLQSNNQMNEITQFLNICYAGISSVI